MYVTSGGWGLAISSEAQAGCISPLICRVGLTCLSRAVPTQPQVGAEASAQAAEAPTASTPLRLRVSSWILLKCSFLT